MGARIAETAHVDGVERTTFLCPYRNPGRTWLGEKRICQDVLDRVDDGYVTYLRTHKDIEYQRPRSCADLEYCDRSDYRYLEVSVPED